MNKKEFLSALRETLAVLKEEELRDIIDEYEQHIDMKVANGLSEEEAIADFGDYKELTSELLEAYHVRADYAVAHGPVGRTDEPEAAGSAEENGRQTNWRSGWGPGSSRETAWDVSGEAGTEQKQKAARNGLAGVMGDSLIKICRALKKGWLWLWNGMKYLAGWFWQLVRGGAFWLWKTLMWCWRQARRPFVWLAGLWATSAGTAGTEKNGEIPMADRKDFWPNLGGGIAAFVRWCASGCVWCIRLIWNACCVGASVLIGIMGIFFLFMLGMLFVLLVSGYPTAGLTLAFLGAVMCLFAAAGFCMTLLWTRKRRVPADGSKAVAEPAGEEERSRA